jgi:hypothetical protein
VVIACYGMLQLNHSPSCRMQDRLDIRRPNVVFATSSNRRPMEFERKSEESLHRERQAVVRRLPLFAPQDGRQIWTGRLLNCQCSSRLFTLIGAPTIIVA